MSLEGLHCLYFQCVKDGTMRCCASCANRNCEDRCLNRCRECGLCLEFPRTDRLESYGEETEAADGLG